MCSWRTLVFWDTVPPGSASQWGSQQSTMALVHSASGDGRSSAQRKFPLQNTPRATQGIRSGQDSAGYQQCTGTVTTFTSIVPSFLCLEYCKRPTVLRVAQPPTECSAPTPHKPDKADGGARGPGPARPNRLIKRSPATTKRTQGRRWAAGRPPCPGALKARRGQRTTAHTVGCPGSAPGS